MSPVAARSPLLRAAVLGPGRPRRCSTRSRGSSMPSSASAAEPSPRVVDDQQLERRVALCEHRRDRLAQLPGAVERRRDHRDQRFGRRQARRPSPSSRGRPRPAPCARAGPGPRPSSFWMSPPAVASAGASIAVHRSQLVELLLVCDAGARRRRRRRGRSSAIVLSSSATRAARAQRRRPGAARRISAGAPARRACPRRASCRR